MRAIVCAAVLAATSVLIRDPFLRAQTRDAASVLEPAREALGGNRYSGTLTSRFFGRPTAVGGMRKIDVGFNFGF